MIARAVDALGAAGLCIVALSPVLRTAPLGPGTRRYANAVLLVETPLSPPALLALAKRAERALGRRRGRRWGDRAVDIDLLLWGAGRWCGRALMVPHTGLAGRHFVLDPLALVAPDWRVPRLGSVRQLQSRLTARRPVLRASRAGSP